MKQNLGVVSAYLIMLGLIILVGLLQSWSIALSILCFCLISAVMTMGANIQWGYAGLINFGIMGYTALGGLAAVLVSVPPVKEAWQAGGLEMILCAFIIAAIVGGIGNPFGAFLGGYVIAFSEIFLTYAYRKFFVYILPESMEPDSLIQLLSTDYKFAVSFSILVIVLLFRPSGIFKGKVI